MTLRRQTRAILTGIVLITAQLMVVVHSAEHPFHTADARCIVYQHAEQHHMDVAVAGAAVESIFFQIQQAQFVQAADSFLFRYNYLPRAPPAS